MSQYNSISLKNAKKISFNGNQYYPLSYFRRRFATTLIHHDIAEFFDANPQLRGTPNILKGGQYEYTRTQLEAIGCPSDDTLLLCNNNKNIALMVEQWLTQMVRSDRGKRVSMASQLRNEKQEIQRTKDSWVQLVRGSGEILKIFAKTIEEERAARLDLQNKVDALTKINCDLAQNVADLTKQMSALAAMWQ